MMFSKLDLDIRPGSGLGVFEIGQSLWTVLDNLRGLQHTFPQVDVKFDPDSSSTSPVVLHIRPHIDLLFSGVHQRLHTICLRKLRDSLPPLTLRYRDTVISSPEVLLKRVDVRRVLGPTYAGDDLRYPGVWFSFEEDGLGLAGTASGVVSESPMTGVKAASLDDRLQEVKRVVISTKYDEPKDRDILEEVPECPIMYGDLSLAVAKVHDGVTLHFYPAPSESVHIALGETTAQDLNLDLGPPSRVYYKEDERMTIHSQGSAEEEVPESGYFYNYFHHGIDFLLSSTTHVVMKIILHSNVAGTPLFQQYKRCNWEIEGEVEEEIEGEHNRSLETPRPRKRFYDKFEVINHFISPDGSPPSMNLDRTDDEVDITLPNSSTKLYGYDGIILEVTESSEVVSVTLF